MKSGRISKEEDRFIQASVNELSVEQIAKKLDRNPNSVEKYIKKHYGIGLSKEENAAFALKDRPYYVELEEQFTENELSLFEYHWGRIVSQFNSDVFPTEELQIIDVIKMEILMNRCLKSNKDNINQINGLQHQYDQYQNTSILDDEEIERAMNIERQIGALRAAQETIDKNYRELQAKKSSMLKDMKATREQRIKRLEDSKESFSAWLGSIMQDPSKLEIYGREMEKMRLAMEVEREKLSNYHTYEDGVPDQPLLNHESVLKFDSL